jgi:molybdopterin converting factor small subunit
MMKRILFFASLREAAGTGEIQLDTADGITVAQLWAQLASDMEDLPAKVLCAVNQDYVEQDHILTENDHEIMIQPIILTGVNAS